MRLIDVDKLKKKVLMWMPSDPCGIAEKERPIETDIAVSLMMEIEEAPTIEPEPHWIPCSERLPETHTEYVTENPWMQVSITEDTFQLSDPVLGYGKRKYHSNGDPMMSVVWYEDDGYGRTAWTTAPDCEDIDVLAWMPLPEPYKGGDTE